jgi:hypothetical protein
VQLLANILFNERHDGILSSKIFWRYNISPFRSPGGDYLRGYISQKRETAF